uniref:DUF1995 domain-containing protein n=1 Tax=Leersia perrieri TaxID=77586 RepID=A0A0D9VBR3_9ORYZ
MATSYCSISNPPLSKTTFLNKQVPSWVFRTISKGNFGIYTTKKRNLRTGFHVRAVTGGQGTRNASGAEFPSDYTQLLVQAKEAVESAFKDGKQLLEIEFPTAGLQSVPGDGEGGIEMTGSMLLIREFCDRFVPAEKTTRTRIFFPEANEVSFARQSAFEGCSLKLDYLTKPSLFEDFGFTTKVKMSDRVRPEDEIFLVAYPYFNVNVVLLYFLETLTIKDYPPFFYPKLAELSKTFLPKLETVYYIHNFKGLKGGTLFRCYPNPWKVLRNIGGSFFCLHEQEEMPSLKEPKDHQAKHCSHIIEKEDLAAMENTEQIRCAGVVAEAI